MVIYTSIDIILSVYQAPQARTASLDIMRRRH